MTENSGKAAKRGRPFPKGTTGNPNGRPRVNPVFRDRARNAVDQHVLDAWVAEVENKGDGWVKCSELLAAYGYGKPPSAPEDNDAIREGGGGWPLNRAETLALAKGK